jgi:hemerythrin-like domain-containing protein
MPIRRSDALRSLSRDHHLALQLARGVQTRTSPHLRAQLPSEPKALAAHVLRVFGEQLAAHFDAEDRVLLPAIAGKDPALDGLAVEIEVEHVELQALAEKLADTSLDDESIEGVLDRFGRLLESHVRKEERAYYQRIQEVLDAETLDRLGGALERHLATPASAATESAA